MNMFVIDDSYIEILIDRKNFFSDAFYQIMSRSPYELKSRFYVRYQGESGVDAGGLLR